MEKEMEIEYKNEYIFEIKLIYNKKFFNIIN